MRGGAAKTGWLSSVAKMLKVLVISAASVGLLLISTKIQAQDSAVQHGRAFAQTNCARCAIGLTGDSPLPKAQPFRTLHQRYPIEDLAESLAEGIRTGHPAMPEFQLDENPRLYSLPISG